MPLARVLCYNAVDSRYPFTLRSPGFHETSLARQASTPMDQKLAQWLPTPQTAFRSFRFILTLMYIGIIGIIAYFNGLWPYESHFLVGRTAELAILLFSLLALERFEQKRFKGQVPTGAAAALLVARMLLFEGVVALDRSMVSLFLYPIIPFSAYFTLGGNVSSLLGFLYMAIGVWRTWQIDTSWYLNTGTTSGLIAFVFVVMFLQLVAPVIRRDEQSRQQTEQLLADLRASHLKLQVYAAQVAEMAAMEERNRLARDIHDSLGHYLTIVNIQLEKSLAYRDRDPKQATRAIQDAKQAAAEALQDVRRSVGTLRSVDEGFSLETALKALTKGLDDAPFAIELSITGSESGYSRPALMALYRAAQEGLTNVQKYAQAKHVTLSVQFGKDLAQLVLRDNGQGFDPNVLDQPAGSEQQSFGLQGIRERVELISGRMTLRSKPQQGTELSVRVPRSPTELVAGDWLNLRISRVEGE